jgi:CelD/BcsL family acetyltransferase involved in cellulose biosynthesis
VAAQLDDLHRAADVPVTARRPWLTTWLRCYPQFDPVAVLLEGPGRRLDGAALLARDRRMGMTRVVPMGQGPSDQVRLPVRDQRAAEELSVGVSDFLDRLPSPWRLRLPHLPPDDAVTAVLIGRLPHASTSSGDVSPVTRFTTCRDPRSYVSRNHHQQVRRLRNRVQREGLIAEIAHLRATADVADALPEVEVVCRQRDLETRGWSGMDGRQGRFFREVVLLHAARGDVVLTTLRLRGKLAAYVLCFKDGEAYRMWNTRVAPEWRWCGAGRLANDAALANALADPACSEFDWMRGDEQYKHSMANDVVEAVDFFAWSSPAARMVTDARRRLAVLAKGLARSHPRLDGVVSSAGRVELSGRRLRRRLSGPQ